MRKNVTINNKQYIFDDQIRDNPAVRTSFDQLAQQTFDISFEEWHKGGWWQENYQPHLLLRDGKAAANLSVNRIDCQINGVRRRLLQLGTVMTAPEERGQGLCRFLMEEVLRRYLDSCDGIYLYANDSVLDFYPKFGFEQREEYQHSLRLQGGRGQAVRLSMDDPKQAELFLSAVRTAVPMEQAGLLHPESLLMFYCTGPMKEQVYWLPEQQTALVMEQEGEALQIAQMFCPKVMPAEEIAALAAAPSVRQVRFGFTPLDCTKLECSIYKEEDTTFFWHSTHPFWLGEAGAQGETGRMLPILSHA